MSKNSKQANGMDFLTTREAADQLGVALRTVQLWVEAGKLSAWKTAGGHRRIARESVDMLLAAQQAAKNHSGKRPRGDVSRAEDDVYSVLVVDDDAVTREIVVATIRSWNLPIKVATAEDGFSALLHIGQHRPDLLVTDLLMPSMDGPRMIRYLRAMPESRLIDIIAITALSTAEIERDNLLPSDVPVLTKPISFAKLKELVAQRVAARRGTST